jgi:hypothetical protein
MFYLVLGGKGPNLVRAQLKLKRLLFIQAQYLFVGRINWRSCRRHNEIALGRKTLRQEVEVTVLFRGMGPIVLIKEMVNIRSNKLSLSL